LCKCNCGKETIVRGSDLKSEKTKSCGCFLKKGGRLTHGHSKIGKVSKVYMVWCDIKKRCNNKNNKDYKYYGGRGIKVCKRWSKFENFLRDMGEVPSGLTLDRINNDLGYFKKNCRWATRKEQANNQRSNRKKIDDKRNQET